MDKRTAEDENIKVMVKKIIVGMILFDHFLGLALEGLTG